MNQQNQNAPFQKSGMNQQKGILGEPPNINASSGNNSVASTNLMNTVKALAFQKMSENMGNKMGNPVQGNAGGRNTGDGLLGNYQGQGKIVLFLYLLIK